MAETVFEFHIFQLFQFPFCISGGIQSTFFQFSLEEISRVLSIGSFCGIVIISACAGREPHPIATTNAPIPNSIALALRASSKPMRVRSLRSTKRKAAQTQRTSCLV
ncbi:hypothetical protein [Phyllobacterium brassicacearum]|uniref:hypothetical protein n=1 Tax=Phyllobacterium brassicacearum TaxID=314235 RepID=UPI00105BB3D0|nr:hypothetical protein [Phyllobacterium brassicacearum]